jgi:hypothetical protein
VHGGIVALPSFLFTTSRIISGYVGGLPGVHAMWSGADWRWHRWVRRNETIATEASLSELVEHETASPGRAIRQVYHVDFYGADGDKVSPRPRAGASAPTATPRASRAPSTRT